MIVAESMGEDVGEDSVRLRRNTRNRDPVATDSEILHGRGKMVTNAAVTDCPPCRSPVADRH